MRESGEMYLESILILSKKKTKVRAIDIVDMMGFSKPSVSRALSRLREEECIVVAADGAITLTESGKKTADKIYERHRVVTDALIGIGVSPDTAEADACKVEHDISDETFDALKKAVKSKY